MKPIEQLFAGADDPVMEALLHDVPALAASVQAWARNYAPRTDMRLQCEYPELELSAMDRLLYIARPNNPKLPPIWPGLEPGLILLLAAQRSDVFLIAGSHDTKELQFSQGLVYVPNKPELTREQQYAAARFLDVYTRRLHGRKVLAKPDDQVVTVT